MTPESPQTVLSEEEIALLRLVAQGLDDREIAKVLDQSESDVASRLRTMFRKIQVNDRTQAALYALRHGLASFDDPKL